MKNILVSFIFFTLLVILAQPSHGQLRKKKSAPLPQNEIETPKERYKSRSRNQEETKVKVKKKRNYVEKKSKRNSSKNRVSQKSIETVVPIEDSKAFSRKGKRPLKKLKKSKEKSEKIAGSEGNVRVKPPGTDKTSVSDERITHTVKEKSLKKQRKAKEKQAASIADSEGNVRVKRMGSDKVSISDERVTHTVKVKSEKRTKKAKERRAEKIADSDGPVEIKREAYRKRPGTIYREDKKGGAKYTPQGENGAYTYKAMSPEKKEKKIAKKSRNTANFEGNTRIAKRDKDLHPSAAYLEARKKDSQEEKEKLRKKELKKSRTRNGGQPKVVTEKRKKPKYDTRESEIWYE